MKKFITFAALLFVLHSCGQTKMTTPENALTKLNGFINKEKFNPDDSIFYPGIGDAQLKPILTQKINLAAKDFYKIAERKNTHAKEYHQCIQAGLSRFSNIYLNLDTENRERICSYFEELIDIVELESSNGLLNNFMYGFDPSED